MSIAELQGKWQLAAGPRTAEIAGDHIAAAVTDFAQQLAQQNGVDLPERSGQSR